MCTPAQGLGIRTRLTQEWVLGLAVGVPVSHLAASGCGAPLSCCLQLLANADPVRLQGESPCLPRGRPGLCSWLVAPAPAVVDQQLDLSLFLSLSKKGRQMLTQPPLPALSAGVRF